MKNALCLILFLGSSIYAGAQEITLPAIPSPLHFENKVADYHILENNSLQFSAPPKTDLFRASDEGYVVNSSPRLLFKPDSDFVLSAKISLSFQNHWDAGDLIIYINENYWAKFCFEEDFRGQPRVVSVVCNGTADDSNAMQVDQNFVYYKICGSMRQNKFALYYSEDNKNWFPVRTFGFQHTEGLSIGFSVQSPVGSGSTADFSEINYRAAPVNDWWIGE